MSRRADPNSHRSSTDQLTGTYFQEPAVNILVMDQYVRQRQHDAHVQARRHSVLRPLRAERRADRATSRARRAWVQHERAGA